MKLDPPWPPTSKPGDKWGAYRLEADGWWRLDPDNAMQKIMRDTPEPLRTPTDLAAATRRSSQCQCCASPLGEVVHVEQTTRVICVRCFGFIAMWITELEQPNDARTERRADNPD